MSFDREKLLYIAKLAALDIEEKEIEPLLVDLAGILDYVAKVSEEELPKLEPAPEVSALREDIPRQTDRAPLFAAAPDIREDHFVTPIVTDNLAAAPNTTDNES